MVIKVLGTGCPSCKKLEANVRTAINEAGVEASVEKVEDLQKIMEYGVMSTPALVVDEKVVAKGKVLSVGDIKKLIS
ncbi:MAG: small redox-active disulfide protein 2 [Fusobacteria bacterium]|nr:MAG: small redox-active disulfide protein 2 [Fusobacteriota bacterium]KAF0230238.1 MAG: small redox-active disulfide protein [Fusobacteriota bacterium]